jgi:hypothetical protein
MPAYIKYPEIKGDVMADGPALRVADDAFVFEPPKNSETGWGSSSYQYAFNDPTPAAGGDSLPLDTVSLNYDKAIAPVFIVSDELFLG